MGIEENIFKLSMAIKEFDRLAKKSEKEHLKYEKKVKDAIQKKQIKVAQTHAQTSILHKNYAVNYIKLSAQFDAIKGKLQTAAEMAKVVNSIKDVTQSVEKTMDMVNLDKIAETMTKFEEGSMNIDQITTHINQETGRVLQNTAPQREVDDYILQLSDEHNLKVKRKFDQLVIDQEGQEVKENVSNENSKIAT
mmetsp:Transcript_9771/g.14412  ORF Transcript_9771/g.14412 Transcript_9771/m.14412 type:complete len:193 (-) Transcript_9771:106-684(-)